MTQINVKISHEELKKIKWELLKVNQLENYLIFLLNNDITKQEQLNAYLKRYQDVKNNFEKQKQILCNKYKPKNCYTNCKTNIDFENAVINYFI